MIWALYSYEGINHRPKIPSIVTAFCIDSGDRDWPIKIKSFK